MNSMPLGLYEYKKSLVHDSSSFIKLIGFILLIISVIKTSSVYLYLLWILLLFIMVKVSKCDYKTLIDSIFKVKWFYIVILLMNFCFFSSNEPYFKLLIFTPSTIGLMQGINMVCRMIILIVLASILASSTTPIEITKGIGMLLYPLQFIGINVYEISMIISIAISFIPILFEEAEDIRKAQMTRGAKLDSKNLIEKGKSIIPFIVPVFISAFKRADDLSIALVSRGYELNRKKKINFKLSLNKNDYYILIWCVLILTLICILGEVL